MTTEQKAKLEALKAKAAEDLSDSEKTELALLETIGKQARQITEKDSLIGAKGTEIDTLKKDLEGKTGAEKKALEGKLAVKEEAFNDLKEAHEATKEAHKATVAAAAISPTPGHGDTVDPKEVEALEAKAYANKTAKAAVEEDYDAMEDADKHAFRTDPAFKKLILEKALGTGGDEMDSPWGKAVMKDEGTPAETADERMRRLFVKESGNHRRLPPNSSGRGGRGNPLSRIGSGPIRERPVDDSPE